MTTEDLKNEEMAAYEQNDYTRAANAHRVAKHHEYLLRAASNLARRMNELVENLNANGADASINGLGEVQSLGHEVDRECALLDAAKEVWREGMAERLRIADAASQPTPAAQGAAAARQQAANRKRSMGIKEARAMGRRAAKEGASIEVVLTGDENTDKNIREGYDAESNRPKTYPTTDAKGRTIRVTIPE